MDINWYMHARFCNEQITLQKLWNMSRASASRFTSPTSVAHIFGIECNISWSSLRHFSSSLTMLESIIWPVTLCKWERNMWWLPIRGKQNKLLPGLCSKKICNNTRKGALKLGKYPTDHSLDALNDTNYSHSSQENRRWKLLSNPFSARWSARVPCFLPLPLQRRWWIFLLIQLFYSHYEILQKYLLD